MSVITYSVVIHAHLWFVERVCHSQGQSLTGSVWYYYKITGDPVWGGITKASKAHSNDCWQEWIHLLLIYTWLSWTNCQAYQSSTVSPQSKVWWPRGVLVCLCKQAGMDCLVSMCMGLVPSTLLCWFQRAFLHYYWCGLKIAYNIVTWWHVAAWKQTYCNKRAKESVDDHYQSLERLFREWHQTMDSAVFCMGAQNPHDISMQCIILRCK